MAPRDWHDWHAAYDQPDSGLARRLGWVQQQIRVALDAAPPGPVRAISLCAGQGRDLLGVLATHPRRADVTARLVELDPRNADAARRLAAGAGLDGVEVVCGDASLASQYVPLAPAGLVVACGIFGNISEADIERVAGYCTALCATGGTVVWTRTRRPVETSRDLVPQVCAWFEERGFERKWLSDPGYTECCGAHVHAGTPAALDAGATMFTFRGLHNLMPPPR